MITSRRLMLAVLAGFAALSSAWADPCKDLAPVRGQAGKDVIWIPTPEPLVDKMLSAAKVTAQDKVFDLGAGDGIIAITAARKFGAQSVGIEYNPKMADYARCRVQEAGMADKVRIITGDIFQEDFSSANVVTLYLLPDLNLRLRPILLKMKPGTRVVAHAFTMGEWEADEVLSHDYARGYLWIVPAQVEGDWMFTGMEGGPMRVNLSQTFQSIGGTLTRASFSQALVGAKLRGEEISFQFTTPDKNVHTFSGRISEGRISGTVNSSGLMTPVEAKRL
ncbi:MAG: class I SAM-dependent methyltransferase [Betaproteobacteria bacterium]